VTVTLAPHQAELYAAEAATIDQVGRRWTRCADAQAYVDRLIASAWFADRWPNMVACTVVRRGSRSAWSTCEHLDAAGPDGRATEGVILLADGALRQPVLLHELAHLLLPPDEGHGLLFAETLLRLVRHEMGFYAFADFYRSLCRTDAFRSVRADGD
jgi:putative metallohydrolase (TIGR04338 family)